MKTHGQSVVFNFLGYLISFLILPAFFASSAWAENKDLAKHFNAGNEYTLKKDFQKAIKSYQKALKIDKTVAVIHYALANAYLDGATGPTTEADFQKAVKEYQAAIDLNPNIPDFHRNLGYAYALLKRGDLAKKKYDELLKTSPSHAEELKDWIKRSNEKK